MALMPGGEDIQPARDEPVHDLNDNRGDESEKVLFQEEQHWDEETMGPKPHQNPITMWDTHTMIETATVYTCADKSLADDRRDAPPDAPALGPCCYGSR